MKIINQPAICRPQQNFKGFDPNFSYEQVDNTFPGHSVSNAIKNFESEIKNADSVDIGIQPNARYNGLVIKTRTPFITEDSVLYPGTDIYVNKYTKEIDQIGNTLHIPVGIGEKYNKSVQKLVLNFHTEKETLEALDALTTSCKSGFHEKSTPVLAVLMEYSTKISNVLKLSNSQEIISAAKKGVHDTLKKVTL